MKRFRKRVLQVIVVLILLWGAWRASQLDIFYPDKGDIVVSRETTYVTDAPRNPDGTINYAAWLDAHLAEGVTKENNAAIPFLRALGPKGIEKEYRSYILGKLGLSDLTTKGEYFISWKKFTSKKKNVTTRPSSAPAGKTKSDKKALSKRLDRTTKIPWTSKNFPDVAKWLQVNEKPLSLIETGLQKPRYYVPIFLDKTYPTIFKTQTSDLLNQYRFVAKAFAARAMLKLRRGDVQGAWNDTMTTRRLARRIGDGPSILHMLVGVNVEIIAVKAQQYLLSHEALSSKKARSMADDLKTLPPLRGMEWYINHGERLVSLDCIMLSTRADVNDSERNKRIKKGMAKLGIKWNRLLRETNLYYDGMAECCSQPTAIERKLACNRFGNHREETLARRAEESNRSKWKTMLMLSLAPRAVRRNYFTDYFRDILSSIFFSSVERAQAMLDSAVTHRQLTEVTAALALYRAEHGHWPEALKDLTPEILPAVPIDPWSEKPLIYRRDGENFILYSIGANMKDDGGGNTGIEEGDLVVDSAGEKGTIKKTKKGQADQTR